MKRQIFIFMLVAIVMGMCAGTMVSCNSCSKGSEAYHDYDGVVQDFTAGVSHIQALHRQKMYSIIQFLKEQGHEIVLDNYQWRNSLVIFNDTVTLDNIDDLHIVSIRDVFYYWDNQKGPQTQYITDHVKYGTQIPWPINDIWIEDADMSDKPIKLSAEQALSRLKEWNGVLPANCNFIILRLPVGPNDCNVQWVFGDVYDVVFVDAVTGEVRDWDPSFPHQTFDTDGPLEERP